MSDSEDALKAAVDPAFTAQQQAQYEAEQAAEKERAAAAASDCDTSDVGIRPRGGYMLMDPQWVAGGPWNNIPAAEQQGEMNRKHDILMRMKEGTVFGFTASGGTNPTDDLDAFAADLAGYFPASDAGCQNLEAHPQGGDPDARLNYSIDIGNQLAACLVDPNFFVAKCVTALGCGLVVFLAWVTLVLVVAALVAARKRRESRSGFSILGAGLAVWHDGRGGSVTYHPDACAEVGSALVCVSELI